MFSLTTYPDARSIVTAACATLVAAAAMGGPASAQSLGAEGRQDLSFGQIWAGTPASVSPLDVGQSGEFLIQGARGAEVAVQLALPSAMTSARGAQLPLEFGPTDGGYADRPVRWQTQSFDPHVPFTATLGNSGRLYVYLGGTAQPSAQQQAGQYSGTITLTVSYTGN